MNWVFAAFAAIALAGAGGLWWWRTRVSRELALMAATPTSKAAAVATLAPGGIVEVKGTLRCAAPLTAEFSKQPCAYFKAEINREVVYYQRDSQGRSERRTRTEPVHSITHFAPCVVEDDSGKVALNLDGADIEGDQVVNRRESEQRGVAAAVISVAIGGNESATLIHTETILAPDIPIYVLGEVTADHGIGKPSAGSKNRVYVVSNKSEEQRTKDLGSKMTWILVGAAVLLAIAAVLAYFAIKTSL